MRATQFGTEDGLPDEPGNDELGWAKLNCVASYAGLNVSASPSMQYRRPVGLGPSSKTWPRWPPQRRQCTSVRLSTQLLSVVVSIAFGKGCQKLGQPVPLSNFVDEAKSGKAQPRHRNVPLRCSLRSGLVQGASVPCWRRMLYSAG